MEEGKYLVWLKKEDVRFTVVVHEGKYWDISNDFILKKRCLLYRGHQKLDPLRLDKVELVEQKVDQEIYNFLDLTPGGSFAPEKLRFHVWAFTFYPYALDSQLLQSLNHLNHGALFKTELFPILNQRAMYLDQRTLGDENRYIIERQMQKEHPVGIIMEKPSVILKKNYVKDTKFEEEKLSAGTEYMKEK